MQSVRALTDSMINKTPLYIRDLNGTIYHGTIIGLNVDQTGCKFTITIDHQNNTNTTIMVPLPVGTGTSKNPIHTMNHAPPTRYASQPDAGQARVDLAQKTKKLLTNDNICCWTDTLKHIETDINQLACLIGKSTAYVLACLIDDIEADLED